MQSKTIEIRDRATFIPALAVRLDPETERDRYLIARAGYGRTPADQASYVVLCRLEGRRGAQSDPYEWNDRTFRTAHQHIIDHWNDIASGDVVDVEFVLGEKASPSVSEAVA